MTGSAAVLADPQASIAYVLKPPTNFEEVYQGVPHTTPIPFVQADPLSREFRALDAFAGKPGVASTLARFVPVPFASSLYILIPVPLVGTVETQYEYELRWRIRTLTDWDRSVESARFSHPWQLVPQNGAPAPTGSGGATEQLLVMPSFCSEVLDPSRLGSDDRVLVSRDQYGVSSQGIYTPASTSSGNMNAALGPVCYPPFLRESLGNELSICARLGDEADWDFTGADAAFSNLYGTNLGGTTHPAYPGVGIYLVSMSRSTAP